MAKLSWGKVLTGVAATVVAGAAYVYLKQRTAKAPMHEVLLADGACELRRYPALHIIETIQHGSRDRALGNGFGLLADYMFGEERDGDEIPIVMPVLAAPAAAGGWRIRFIITDEYLPLSEAPGEGIVAGDIPTRQVAAIAVPGKATDRAFAARTAELERWVAALDRVAAGPAEHAYYNSPLKPGLNRANEILIPLL